MSVIVILVFLALAISGTFLILYIYATQSDQFTDAESAAINILNDDTLPENPQS